MAALHDGVLEAASRSGRRTIKIADWVAGIMTNTLEPGELLTGVELKAWPAGHGYAFEEFARRHGDFAITAVGCLLTLDASGAIDRAALCVSRARPGAGAGRRSRAPAGRRRSPRMRPSAPPPIEAEALDAMSDAYVSAAYRKHLARVLTYRALERAVARAQQAGSEEGAGLMGRNGSARASSARKTRRSSPAAAAIVDDIKLPACCMRRCCAARTRTPRIRGIDKRAALALPGVHAVFTYADLPESMQRQTRAAAGAEPDHQAAVHALLPRQGRGLLRRRAGRDRGGGQPLSSPRTRPRWSRSTTSRCRRCPIARAALEPGAPLAHRGVASNNRGAFIPINVGNTDAAFAQAAHVFREKIFQHRGGPFFMECRGMVAVPRRGRPTRCTIYVSSQGPHRIKRVLLDLLDLGDHQLRVVTPDVGGGFGPKGAFYAGISARSPSPRWRCGRPVKWIEDRRENFLATHQERDQYWDVEIAVDARREASSACAARWCTTTGAYVPWGVVLPWIAATTVPGPYVIPNFKLDVSVAFTNKIPTTPVRGAGRPEARVRDGAADGPRRARAEARSAPRCAGAISSSPSRCPTRSASSSATAARSPTTAATIRPARRARSTRRTTTAFARGRREARKQGRYIGIGIGNAVEATGLGPYESATVRVSTTGKIARLHRRDAAGPVAQDDARADRRRSVRLHASTTSRS